MGGDGEVAPMRKAIRALLDAMDSGNEDAAEQAFKDCFQCCESEPHEEAGDIESSEE
jgi:hypothetical protein